MALPPPTARSTTVSKKLAPGQPGTKRYLRQYGDALVCVRYRTHAQTAKRYTTVEIVVDEWSVPGHAAGTMLAENRIVAVKIAYGESELRRKAKQAGAKWERERQVWLMPYGAALNFGLVERIHKSEA